MPNKIIPELSFNAWVDEIYIWSIFRSISFDGCYKSNFKAVCMCLDPLAVGFIQEMTEMGGLVTPRPCLCLHF